MDPCCALFVAHNIINLINLRRIAEKHSKKDLQIRSCKSVAFRELRDHGQQFWQLEKATLAVSESRGEGK